jgi:hypothetical protein
MKNSLLLFFATSFLLSVGAAQAEPIGINDQDEGYARLSRWEQHLDDRIAYGVRRHSLDPRRAWWLQRNLDSIEAHVVQSYYQSNNGIDRDTFRQYASQLRNIGQQLGEGGWAEQNNVFSGDWSIQGSYGDNRGNYNGNGH